MTLHIRPEWVVLLLMWAFVIALILYVAISWVQTYQAMTP